MHYWQTSLEEILYKDIVRRINPRMEPRNICTKARLHVRHESTLTKMTRADFRLG